MVGWECLEIFRISKNARSIADIAAKFERIRRAHQNEVAEDYVEMIAELIETTGEARAVDLAQRFGVTTPTVNASQRLQKDGLVNSRPYRSIFLTDLVGKWRKAVATSDSPFSGRYRRG